MADNSQTKQFMRDRKESAEFVYNSLKEMQRATFDVAAQWGRWLLASLLLIHGGALFGLFTFLSDLASKPDALSQYQLTVWWFVSGLILTLTAGTMAWLNWSMHSENYGHIANPVMLWDPEVWTREPQYVRGLWWTHWIALVCGVASALCIIGGAYSTLNSRWVTQVVTAIV